MFRLCIFLSIYLFACNGNQLPDYITPCSRKDPYLNICIKNIFNGLACHFNDGIPELNIPPLEPMLIDALEMQNDAGSVRVKARFFNINAKGASNMVVREIRSNISQLLRLNMSVRIPRLEATGEYDVSGKVLLLPVASKGKFWAEFGDIHAIAKAVGEEYIQDGKTFVEIKKLIIDFNLKNAKFKIDDSHRNVIDNAINALMNKHALEIIQEMRPVASKSIAKFFRDILNNAFSTVELNQILKD